MSTNQFLAGLKKARELYDLHDGKECLDALIAQHEADLIETAAVTPIAETR